VLNDLFVSRHVIHERLNESIRLESSSISFLKMIFKWKRLILFAATADKHFVALLLLCFYSFCSQYPFSFDG